MSHGLWNKNQTYQPDLLQIQESRLRVKQSMKMIVESEVLRHSEQHEKRGNMETFQAKFFPFQDERRRTDND